MTGNEPRNAFAARRDTGAKLLVPYVTGGLGREWHEVVRAVVGAGADAVEVGIPFSDPIMDGRTIQEASQRALDLGATPVGVIDAMATIDVPAPLVVMTYYNLVARMGHERCAQHLRECGVDGAIVPDLPYDELERVGRRGRRGRRRDGAARRADDSRRTARADLRTVARFRLRRVADGCHRRARRARRSHAGEMGRRCKAATDKPVLLGCRHLHPRTGRATAPRVRTA